MTQRSQQRWNTGKRGASQRRANRNGVEWAKRNAHLPKELIREAISDYEMSLAFRCPDIAQAFTRGAWKWVESQPVEF